MKLIIKERAWQKFLHMVDKAPGEVSGLGSVEMVNGNPVVTDVWLVKQVNSGASTDLDAEAVSKLLYEHRDKDLKWWVHSHAHMSAFWSGTDTDTIRELGGQGWICATVVNKKRELKSAIFCKAKIVSPMNNDVPKDHVIYDENVTTLIQSELPAGVLESWDKEYEETCQTRSYLQPWTPTEYANSDEWAKRRAHPAWDAYQADRCCHDWDKYLKEHSAEVAELVKGKSKPTELAVVRDQVSGDETAQMILDEKGLNQDEREMMIDYDALKEEVEQLYDDNMQKEQAMDLVCELYGETWRWIVAAMWQRIDYHKKTKGAADA